MVITPSSVRLGWFVVFVGLAATSLVAFATSAALVVPVGVLLSAMAGLTLRGETSRDPLSDDDDAS